MSDITALVQVALKTADNARKACGEHAQLTHETLSVHVVSRRLQHETANPENPINRPDDSCREERASNVLGCKEVFTMVDRILERYSTLKEEEKNMCKLWQKVCFSNEQIADVGDLRSKIIFYTTSISLYLNMVSMNSIGRVEKQMDVAGGDLKKIRPAVNGITAHLLAGADKDDLVLTAYLDDEKAVWREFRREPIRNCFS